ncbi:MAG: DNA polymerase I [Bacteroidales bacterium]|nr:DNA polymerase I [Bacteroidales bacterium]MBN2821558.1 DNA polymerase I [Bacteroidales bacterium]
MNSEKKLFLLDAYALIFRAYYAFINRPITNKEGMNTSAIFGFVNTLDEILRNEKPTHIAVAFDPPAPTFRHEMYKEYKANRESTPEDIKLAVPYIKEILDAYHIPIVEKIGFEADDVVGTIAKKAEKEGFTVYMMTPDKDYMQLVSEKIFMYKPGRGGGEKEIIGIQEVKEKFDVQEPLQVIDILALWGDSSDNVPGAPGIGEKTAKKLIETYHSVENLLASTHELKGKQKESLENFREQVILSKKLVTIDLNVPIDINFDAYKLEEPDTNKLVPLFDKLDFRVLKNRYSGKHAAPSQPVQGSLFGDMENTSQQVVIENEKESFIAENVDYKLLDSKNILIEFIERASEKKLICFDTETTGLNVFTNELIGIALSISEKEAYYISCKSRQETEEYVQELNALFSDESIEKIGHNLKFDMQFLNKYGAEFKGPLFDTMVAHYLLKPDGRHKLDLVVEEYFGYRMIPITELIGKKGPKQLNMQNIDVNRVKDYASEDADYTLRLYNVLKPELEKAALLDLAKRIEMPLVEVLFHMEQSGFNLDINALNTYNRVLLDEISGIEKEIYKLAGEEFNIASPRQLGVILFEKLAISDNAKRTKTKQYSTGEEILQKLVDKHPIINQILEYRSLSKLQSTYVSALPQLIEKQTNKIHTSFNQTIAATGRLSSVNPNLQNIPIREERGREIRKSFIPTSPEYILLAADYSQVELRLMAHLSKDEHMIEAFRQGSDIHRSTAAKVFKVSEDDVSREMRSQAKTANFGIIYGISAFGLAERLKISRTDAKQLIDSYFETFPGVKLYMDACVEEAKKHGYVTTMFGRKRYLPDIHSANAMVRGFAERNAINSPIQGSAADIIKIAMIRIHKAMQGRFKSKMILQVHDELVFDVFKPELEELKALVIKEMEGAADLLVPLTVDTGTGENWLEAH